MGFRKDAWATVWGTEVKSDTNTVVRLSINRKDKNTEEYVQDFGGFVSFVGTATAKQAAKLKEKDRIKLGDVDVSNKYDKEKNVTYTNFKCYNFILGTETTKLDSDSTEPQPTVDEGINEDRPDLPF